MSKPIDADDAFIASALPAFLSEADEQTEAMENLLLELESEPQDRELLDSLFRCAHTVKGSAGIFGLDDVVEFTHHVETLLDLMRAGKLLLNSALSTLLLECNDEIKWLVRTSTGQQPDTEHQIMHRADLIVRLRRACESEGDLLPDTSGGTPTASGWVDGAGSTSKVTADGSLAGAAASPLRHWTISARFLPDTFRNGMDPLAILRYVAGMGQVVSMVCDVSRVPTLDDIDPESCYLSFVMKLDSSASREEIQDAFSFVIDDCELTLTVEATQEELLARAIEDLPSTPRLGDLLLTVGAVTPDKLSQALTTQEQGAASSSNHAKTLLGDLLQSQAGVAPEVVQAALGKQQKMRESSGAEEGRYIRVQADRLDAVINLLGELVIAGSGAMEKARESRLTDLIEINLHINRLIEEIRNGTLGLRMVPVGETFSRFRRVVRDTASSLGKEVNFEIIGGEAELDKSMVEKIADPLMHLVRNSLDHGLEPPHERLAAGKSNTGKLVLSARHEAGAILIRIEDDGRGINHEKVLQRAWSRGLVEQGVVPDGDAINMLIFEPGFSTAEQITNLSGRGVGMDVVRRNIEALRGSIKLNNFPGLGLQVDIRLPLTLAIIDGFLVGVGPSKFVLPLESVVEVVEGRGALERERHDSASDALAERGRFCVELRGELLPVVSLRGLYALDSKAPERVSVVVVSTGDKRFGIEVDALLGQHQTVIKPLGRIFRTLRGISGSTILGNGEVALIVDVHSLGSLASSDGRRTDIAAATLAFR
jgi:two-component system chemotaxis sensor kinase CheA